MADTDDSATQGGVPLAQVIGRNARQLRGDATADQLAKEARFYGLNWGTGRISDLEHGRVSPTLGTLVALALALQEVRFVRGPDHGPVTLADLVRCDENIALTKDLSVTEDELATFLEGGEVSLSHRHADLMRSMMESVTTDAFRKDWPHRLHGIPKGPVLRMLDECGEAEQRLEREFALDTSRLCAEMISLWGRTYTAERDERAGAGANAQKKGRVARKLKAELKAVLDGDNQ
ncbi:helix-turn-helix domain-containing protein [Mycolicibacter algericus]|uniref:helix-turn-helix domain-containing protein n=1 Tax=Mycolicibacter algericus TaxID=1288388 RepID=UPI003C754DA6